MNTSGFINIVIGNPELNPVEMFARDEKDWIENEKESTFFTEETSLAKILVELDIYPSIGEIRRNKPELMINFTEHGYHEIMVNKKKKFMAYILV